VASLRFYTDAASPSCPSPCWGEVQADDQSHDVQLPIWTLACVVLVFVVGIELLVPVKFGQWQQATNVKTYGTPLGILALV
jgi:hypothetical protein